MYQITLYNIVNKTLMNENILLPNGCTCYLEDILTTG